MSVLIRLDNIVPNTPSADGWKVEYRIKGTVGAYITPPGSPYSSFPIEITTTDPGGTLYEGRIWNDCGEIESTRYDWVTPCDCYGLEEVNGIQCRLTETTTATIDYPEACIIVGYSPILYTSLCSRIYNVGFSAATVALPSHVSNTFIYGTMTYSPQWKAAPPYSSGTFDREAVAIDTNCDGVRDDLISNYPVTIPFTYFNAGAEKTIYIGVSANANFLLIVNGVIIVNSPAASNNFWIFHIMPVTIKTGYNYINVICPFDLGTGTKGGVAVVGYDNTASEIAAAISDAALNILFKSSNLRGLPLDIGYCNYNAGYTLHTEGVGATQCKRITTSICNPT